MDRKIVQGHTKGRAQWPSGLLGVSPNGQVKECRAGLYLDG